MSTGRPIAAVPIVAFVVLMASQAADGLAPGVIGAIAALAAVGSAAHLLARGASGASPPAEALVGGVMLLVLVTVAPLLIGIDIGRASILVLLGAVCAGASAVGLVRSVGGRRLP